MSKENVDLAHRSIDAMNRRDLDAYLALMDEDVEAVSRIVAVEGGMHGHDGIRRWWESWSTSSPTTRSRLSRRVTMETWSSGPFALWATVREATCPSRTQSGTQAGGSEGSASGGKFSARRRKRSKPQGFRNSRFGREAATSDRTGSVPGAVEGGRAGWPKYEEAPVAGLLRVRVASSCDRPQ